MFTSYDSNAESTYRLLYPDVRFVNVIYHVGEGDTGVSVILIRFAAEDVNANEALTACKTYDAVCAFST